MDSLLIDSMYITKVFGLPKSIKYKKNSTIIDPVQYELHLNYISTYQLSPHHLSTNFIGI